MDEEIKILIEAVDNATDKLQNIENTLTKSSKNIAKQTENTSNAFKEQTGQLLVLMNVAQNIDNVFSAYQNLQLRIENATERVIGAHERLRSAQEKLIDTQIALNDARESNEKLEISLLKYAKDEKKVTEDLRKEQEKLADMQNRDVLPTSKRYQETLESIAEKELELREIQVNSKEIQRKSEEELMRANRNYISAQKDVESATRGVTIAENNLERANNQVLGTYLAMGVNSITAINGLISLQGQMKLTENATSALGGAIGTKTAGTLIGGLGLVGLLVAMGLTLKEINTQVEREELEKLRLKTAELGNAADTTRQKWIDLQNTMYPKSGTAKTEIPKVSNIQINPQTINPNTPTEKKTYNIPGWGDFISRPGTGIQSFSPDDTIIGVDDVSSLKGSSYNITINGDNYGVDAEQISDALMRKLRMRISI